MINAQEWLDEKYPREERGNIIDLYIGKQELEGDLKLEGFSKLEVLYCHDNKLTRLNLSQSSQLEEINCSNNLLTGITFSSRNPENLTRIYLNNNNFSSQDLSRFRSFVVLEHLALGNDNQENIKKGVYNCFYGSLEPLKNLKYLESLDIEGTDIDSGLEHLSVKYLKEFSCAKIREGARVESIKNTLNLSEEEAKSAEKEVSKYKINKIKSFQLNYLWKKYLNKSKLLSLKIRVFREKLEDKDLLVFLQDLLITHKKAIAWGRTQETNENLRKIKQNLIKELTPNEINDLCRAQTQLVEARKLFSQRRQQLEAQTVNRLGFFMFTRH